MGVRRGGQEGAFAPLPLSGLNSMFWNFLKGNSMFLGIFKANIMFLPPLENLALLWKKSADPHGVTLSPVNRNEA
jgi:hypothetical protein